MSDGETLNLRRQRGSLCMGVDSENMSTSHSRCIPVSGAAGNVNYVLGAVPL